MLTTKMVFNIVWYFTLTVEPVHSVYLGTNQQCPDYQGVLIFQVSLYTKLSFGTTIKCVDYAGVLINRFHSIHY